MMWSDYVNNHIYQLVAFVLQASQAHNITIDGGVKYNVPSGNIVIDGMGNTSPPNLTSYTTAAVIGVDDFNDDNTTLNGVFDIIVNTTRQITPTCMFLNSLLPVFFVDLSPIKSEQSGILGVYTRGIFGVRLLMKISTVSPRLDGPSALWNDSPRSLPGNSRIRFSSSETLCVHDGQEMNHPAI